MRLDTFDERDDQRLERAYWGPGATWEAPEGERWRIVWFVFIGLWLGFLVQFTTIAIKILSAPFKQKRPAA